MCTCVRRASEPVSSTGYSRTAGTDYLDIAPVILSLTLDVIGRAAFGVQLCAQEEKSKEYMEVHPAREGVGKFS